MIVAIWSEKLCLSIGGELDTVSRALMKVVRDARLGKWPGLHFRLSLILWYQPLAYPPSLVPLLDEETKTDELCCCLEIAWPILERWRVAVGEGSDDGAFGKNFINSVPSL